MDEQLERYRAAYEHEPWHDAEIRMSRSHRWLMRGIWAIVIIIGLGLVWSVRAAEAQEQQARCRPLPVWQQGLQQQFKESVIGYGRVDDKNAVLFFATRDGKTFTILSVNINGMACLLAAGEDLDLSAMQVGEES